MIAEGWLVMNGSMMRQVAASCHKPRNAASTAIWTTTTLGWRKRRPRRNCAWRGDTAPRLRKPLEGAPFNIQILPNRLAVGAEFRGVARIHRCPLGRDRERDVVDVLDLGRAAAQHDDPVRHRHRLLDVVGDEQRSLLVIADDAEHVALEDE